MMAAAAKRITLCQVLRRFAHARDAVSAIEFAFVLPCMLTLYIGGVELGDGLQIDFKVTETARTVSDLASQYASIDSPTMAGILQAASSIVSPYPASNMAVTVTQITTDSGGQGTVNWSCTLNGTAYAVGSAFTLPSKLQSPNITLILGEVAYPYTPTIGYYLTGTINIYQNAYFYPRLVNSITGPSSC